MSSTRGLDSYGSIFALLTRFDAHSPSSGIMQIVVFRMLRSSSIFFALLAILAVGFAQALSGLGGYPNPPRGDVSEVLTTALDRHRFETLHGGTRCASLDAGAVGLPSF